jgi:hypothetical protein
MDVMFGILSVLSEQIEFYSNNAIWVNKTLTHFHTIQEYQPFIWEDAWLHSNRFDDIIARFYSLGIVYNLDLPLEEQLDIYNEAQKVGYDNAIQTVHPKVSILRASGYTGGIPQGLVLGKTGILSHVRPFPRAGEI